MWFYIIDGLLILAVLFTIIFTIVRCKSSNMKTSMFATLISVYSVILVLLIGSMIGFHFLFEDYQYVQSVADAYETKAAIEKGSVETNLIGKVDKSDSKKKSEEQDIEEENEISIDETEEIKDTEVEDKVSKVDESAKNDKPIIVEKVKGRYSDFAQTYLSEWEEKTDINDLEQEFELKGISYKDNIERLEGVAAIWSHFEEEIYKYLKNSMEEEDFCEMYGFYGALQVQVLNKIKAESKGITDKNELEAIKLVNNIRQDEIICKYLIDYMDLYSLEVKPNTLSVVRKYFSNQVDEFLAYEQKLNEETLTQLEITESSDIIYHKWLDLNEQLYAYYDGLNVYNESSVDKEQKLFLEDMVKKAKEDSLEYEDGSLYNSAYNTACSNILKQKISEQINGIK